MKKITLSLVFLLAMVMSGYGQVSYQYGWEPTGLGSWTSTGFSRSTVTPCLQTASVRVNAYEFSPNHSITSPSLGTSNGGVVALNFDYKVINYSGGAGTPANQLEIITEWSNSVTGPWNLVGTIDENSHTVSNTCATMTFNFSATAGSLFIRFKANSINGGDSYFYIDNVIAEQGAPPSCVSPTALTASAVTNSTATISWTAPTVAPTLGYKYYVSTSNTTPALTEGVAAAGLTADLTSLLDNTKYYLWVRSLCTSSDESVWAGPVTFKTTCVSFPIPFVENFNSDSDTKGCWTVINANNDAILWNTSYTSNPINGDQSAVITTDYAAGANDDWLISPKITLTGNERLKFKYKAQSSFEPNDFMVKLSTTGNTPADFTTVLMPLTEVSSIEALTKTISLTSYTGDVFVAFHVPPGGLDGYRLFIDDVEVEPTPSTAPGCIQDMNTVTNVGCGNSPTTFTWGAIAGIDGYKVTIGTSISDDFSTVTDIVEGQNNKDIGNVLTYSFVGNPNTTYYYVVKPFAGDLTAVDCYIDNFTTDLVGCYCPSVPTSSDGTGVTNVQVNSFSQAVADVTYTSFVENGPIDITRGVNTVMNLTMATGYRYYTNIWIDYNNNYTFEPSELVYTGQAPNNTVPSIVETTFMTSLTANLGQHRMRSISTYSNITPANPCYSSYDGVTIDYLVNVLEAPTCLPPTASSVTNITSTGATLNWVSTGTTFKVEYGELGFVQGSASGTIIDPITGNSTTLSNLSSQADYSYYIQTVCGTSNLSPWTGPFTFRTGCASFGDFTEDFTTTTTIPAPECWYTLKNAVNTNPSVQVYYYNGYASFSNSNDAAAALYMVTPSLTALPANTHRIKFKAYGPTGTSLIVGTMTDPANESTFTAVQAIQLTTSFADYAVAFMGSTTDQHVAFKFVGTATYQTVNLDDVVWEPTPACADIYVVSFNGATPTTADISWAPGGGEVAWQYAYALSTTTSPAGLPLFDVTTASATIIDLQPSSTYKVWVRAVCGADFGNWSPAKTIITACLPVTTFPWTEGFESLTTVGSNSFPPCWFKENGDFSTSNTGTTTFTTPRNGNNYLRNLYAAENEYMWTPGFELTAGVSYDFSFFMQGDGYTSWNVDVFQNTIQSSVGATQLGGTTSPGGPDATVVQPYQLISNTIVPATSGIYYFAVRVHDPSFSPYSIGFDDFRLEPTPTCVAPAAPTATDVTITTATMNWTATTPAPSGGYDYFYTADLVMTPNATTEPSGTVLAGVTTASLTGLVGSTTYKIYVRSICGTNDKSSWSYAGTFTSSCINATLPYTIDFENAVVPNLPLCTYNQNMGTGANWKTSAAPGYGFDTKVLRYDYTGSAANTWFYTNTVTLTAGTNYSIAYQYGNNISSTWSEKLRVSYGATANAAAMTTELADHPSIGQGTLQSNSVTFTPPTTGDYVFGFNVYSDEEQYYLFVDNIVIQEALGTTDFDNNTFTAYPNPVKDVLNVSFTQNISNVAVYNLLGQQVLSVNMNANKGQVDMSTLATGTYLVKVNSENGVKTIKVIKE
ncbi:T9SS-dependent choice-of-anchor J family protein [Flavobacterium antarcticum]|uniref:T9SS-dependent choice-of-anchor J family protein n=1 Tax=Flavobacterium antarcticum TaxID=271155 RepID=UPI0003B539CD|nr:choice-of-anchor J domain-containing protein [Flavobacterium antarcticum]